MYLKPMEPASPHHIQEEEEGAEKQEPLNDSKRGAAGWGLGLAYNLVTSVYLPLGECWACCLYLKAI